MVKKEGWGCVFHVESLDSSQIFHIFKRVCLHAACTHNNSYTAGSPPQHALFSLNLTSLYTVFPKVLSEDIQVSLTVYCVRPYCMLKNLQTHLIILPVSYN